MLSTPINGPYNSGRSGAASVILYHYVPKYKDIFTLIMNLICHYILGQWYSC